MEINQKNGKVTVQIDRTKPTIASLRCEPEASNKIKMTANGAKDNTDGSGIAEYMYFVDNKAGASDTIVRTNGNTNTTSFTADMGRYLGQVAVVDKAGNISNVQGDPDARTQLYSYEMYSAPTSVATAWEWQPESGEKRIHGDFVVVYNKLVYLGEDAILGRIDYGTPYLCTTTANGSKGCFGLVKRCVVVWPDCTLTNTTDTGKRNAFDMGVTVPTLLDGALSRNAEIRLHH